MYSRILKLPLNSNNSLFLFGPRGTGKTTWIKSYLNDAIYLDLLEFQLFRELQADPSRLEKLIPEKYSHWIILDEVQKIPELLNEVHRLIESKGYRFLLTGSSARSLKRKGVNLLAGRAHHYFMHPLIYQELNEHFNLEKVIEYGLLPATFSKDNPKQFLQTYIETYLREEVMQEGLSRNISAFSAFLEVASFSQGSTVTMTDIAREIGIDRQVVKNYFSILEDMLLAIELPIFAKRAKRRLISHNKFYYFDIGVYKHLRPTGPLDTSSEINGSALETLVLQSLRAVNDYYQLDYTLYFWRTSNGTEVDFILYGKKGLYAIEVKHTRNITGKLLRGLKAFKQDYEPAKLFLVYMGDYTEYHDDITIMPVIEFLKQLPTLLNNAEES